MRINRGLVFWGVALITAGAVALAIQAGAIDGELARQWWRFWPVALIVVGLAIIAARTQFALIGTLAAGIVIGGLGGSLVGGWPDALSIGCGGEPDTQYEADGTFGARAEVELDFDCGELAVTTEPGSGWRLDAAYAGDARPSVSSDSGSLRIDAEDVAFPFGNGRQEWQVTLPTDVDVALEIDANAASSDLDLANGRYTSLAFDTNAGSATIDLSGARVDDMTIEMNAGSVAIIADDGTTLDGSIDMNAGSLEVCIPDGVALAITIPDANITFSHNLDDAGLTRTGDTWSSGGGTPAVALEVHGNAASFTLNPEEGCS